MSTRKEWLTVTDACDYLGVARSTLDKWRARGVGPRFKKLPNGSLRTCQDWLEDFLTDLPDAA